MIIGDWLVELAHTGKPQRDIAIVLLRALAQTVHRSHHSLDLSTEYMRRRICHAARWGRIAAVVVQCEDCGCQARLSEWVRAAALDMDTRHMEWRAVYDVDKPWIAAYLRACPGRQYRRDVAASVTLPADRGE